MPRSSLLLYLHTPAPTLLITRRTHHPSPSHGGLNVRFG